MPVEWPTSMAVYTRCSPAITGRQRVTGSLATQGGGGVCWVIGRMGRPPNTGGPHVHLVLRGGPGSCTPPTVGS